VSKKRKGAAPIGVKKDAGDDAHIPENFRERHREFKEQKLNTEKETQKNSAKVGNPITDYQSSGDESTCAKEFCKKHYQQVVKVMHPDFQKCCMKCLREVFLRQSVQRSTDGLAGMSQIVKSQVADGDQSACSQDSSKSTGGQEYLRAQINQSIQGIQHDFLNLMQEFQISQDIKGGFCEFSSKRVGILERSIDAAYKEVKDQIIQNVSSKLVSYAKKVDGFDAHF